MLETTQKTRKFAYSPYIFTLLNLHLFYIFVILSLEKSLLDKMVFSNNAQLAS